MFAGMLLLIKINKTAQKYVFKHDVYAHTNI